MTKSFSARALLLIQQITDADCTIPDHETLARVAAATNHRISDVRKVITYARSRSWPITTARSRKKKPNQRGAHFMKCPLPLKVITHDCTGKFTFKNPGDLFRLSEITTSKIAQQLCNWALRSAGTAEQSFYGPNLTPQNSRCRYIEFDCPTLQTYVISGDDEHSYTTPRNVVRSLQLVMVGGAELLGKLYQGLPDMLPRRCFINVMQGRSMGAGKHIDLDAPMGSVIAKLSGLDPDQEALHVFPSKKSENGLPIPLRTAEAVAFLPGTYHMVPSVSRRLPRVTMNIFYTQRDLVAFATGTPVAAAPRTTITSTTTTTSTTSTT
jgi:hypothetical protein